MTRLSELATLVRSKSAGRFTLTIDIIFCQAKWRDQPGAVGSALPGSPGSSAPVHTRSCMCLQGLDPPHDCLRRS